MKPQEKADRHGLLLFGWPAGTGPTTIPRSPPWPSGQTVIVLLFTVYHSIPQYPTVVKHRINAVKLTRGW